MEQIVRIYAKDATVDCPVDPSFFQDAGAADEDKALFERWFGGLCTKSHHQCTSENKIEEKTEEPGELTRRAMTRSPSSSRKRMQSTISPEDLRSDPDTGKVWCFKNFRDHFKSQYDEVQVQQYWQVA